jgi:hypothetical protein
VKVLDIKVGEAYSKLLAEKANLEVQIETEEKRRQQIEAQQANNLFQAEQEATVALTTEKGRTAAQLEAASRDAQVRTIQGRYWRENPELFELRKRELHVELLKNGNLCPRSEHRSDAAARPHHRQLAGCRAAERRAASCRHRLRARAGAAARAAADALVQLQIADCRLQIASEGTGEELRRYISTRPRVRTQFLTKDAGRMIAAAGRRSSVVENGIQTCAGCTRITAQLHRGSATATSSRA